MTFNAPVPELNCADVTRSLAFYTDVLGVHRRLTSADYPVFVAPEDKWYRTGGQELGFRQFLIQDPDGYLPRFAQSLGTRNLP